MAARPDSPHRLGVLVLTRSQPSWEHLVEQAGWPSADEPQALVRPYQPLLNQVVRGQEFAFRFRGNPVAATKNPIKPSPAQQARLSTEGRRRGVRVPHRTARHQLDWFTSRMARSEGFELVCTEDGQPDVLLVERNRLVFGKSGRNSGDGASHRVVLQTATFEGRIRIGDPEAARRGLLDGIGPGKAYGCGLLTLAPLHRPQPQA